MHTQTIYNRFLNEIKKHLPQKVKRTSILADILSIEKEAIYRRLRGEVPFTFHEIILLSNKFNISIDNIIGITSEKSRPFHLKMSEFVDPFDIDYKMFEEYIEILDSCQDEEAEVVEVTNMLPQSIFLKFDQISKFYYYKWHYHYNQSDLRFKDFHLSKRIKDLQDKTFIASKKVRSTTYIWDPLIIQHLVNDICFIQNLHLVTQTEVASLKQELYGLLNYTEQTAEKGTFIETNNEVNFYISTIALDTNYSYISTKGLYISLIKVFILTGISSLDKKTFEKTKAWIQSLKRTSTLISICGEKQRIAFFEKQRKLVDQL